ncbi:sensor histidine kinase [Reichenbachiella versicolor]|uniref:sensor histidine kinase n=1 Tax=Reichenbachiella versicolor TaxID=1821036 RepID=UPI000D6DEF94|nr:histidine kinase [Reichenbachiella versicolor]
MLKIKEIYVRWIGIFAVALIITVVFKTPEDDAIPFYMLYGKVLVFCAVLWNGSGFILDYFEDRFPLLESTPKRLLISVVSVTLWLILGANLVSLILGTCTWDNIIDPKFFFRNNNISLIAGIIISSFYVGNDFFEKWKESVRQNEELKNQQIRTQFEVLQNQMSPHFLFNSLNTLTTLIEEDQKVAVDFTQTLSEVYRYILRNKERELVSVHEELEFCKSYVYLLKMRYPENLLVDIKVDLESRQKYVAPLTIQMLLENAIKHNMISKIAPLNIEVYIDQIGEIVVKNTLQIKKSLEKSTKTGLDNIRKRYQFLGDREIKVVTSQKYFRVAIPLIQVQSEIEYLKAQQG